MTYMEFIIKESDNYSNLNELGLKEVWTENHFLHEGEDIEGCEDCKIDNMTEHELFQYYDNRPETSDEQYFLRGA